MLKNMAKIKEKSFMNLIKKVAQISLITFLSACNNKEYIEKKITTQNHKYNISINLPIELDTTYSWIDTSDNLCSDMKKYRFSNNGYPCYMENGFSDYDTRDSICELTIEHNNNFICKSNNEIWDNSILKIKEKLKLGLVADSLEISRVATSNINGRKYLITQYKYKHKYRSLNWIYLTKGITIVDSNAINFEFITIKKNHSIDEFKEMDKVINSIKIN